MSNLISKAVIDFSFDYTCPTPGHNVNTPCFSPIQMRTEVTSQSPISFMYPPKRPENKDEKNKFLMTNKIGIMKSLKSLQEIEIIMAGILDRNHPH